MRTIEITVLIRESSLPKGIKGFDRYLQEREGILYHRYTLRGVLINECISYWEESFLSTYEQSDGVVFQVETFPDYDVVWKC